MPLLRMAVAERRRDGEPDGTGPLVRISEAGFRTAVQNPVRASSVLRLTVMHWIVGLLTILLTGCQGLSLLESPGQSDPHPIMSLWERYQRCRASTDPLELVHMAQQFDTVMTSGVEPPSWLKGWGQHVKAQPIRTALDPRAVGAACTLRAAAVMAQMSRSADARVLYERVLTRYSGSDQRYYARQAKEALDRLSEARPAITASVPLRIRSLDQ